MKKILQAWTDDSYELLGYGNNVLFVTSYIRINAGADHTNICEVWSTEGRNFWYARIWKTEFLQTERFDTAESAMNAVDEKLLELGYRFISKKTLCFL
jgi:hypothetical protein